MGRTQQTAKSTRWWRVMAQVGLVAALGAGLATGRSAVAAVPQDASQAALAPQSELEAAAQSLLAPLAQRHVVRDAEGGLVLWLISDMAFEKAVAEVRRTISTKRTLRDAFTLENWTYVDADRSGLLELAGGSAPRRLRLTRHLHGVLLEVQGGADASEAPRWLPPFRPQAAPLMHGPMVR